MADPTVPTAKKVALSQIQQRIKAVNDDQTLSFALHGDLNRAFAAIVSGQNYNADLLDLVIATLAANNILVKRVADVEAAQKAAVAEAALISSYTDPTMVLSAFTAADGLTASITVINHNRTYADAAKTTVPVIGKTISALAINTVYYLYYDDPLRAGGAVDIKVSTNNLDAAQTGARHSLGSIQTGGATDTDPVEGGGVNPPGGTYRENRIPQQTQQ